jgi:hypothetical protein
MTESAAVRRSIETVRYRPDKRTRPLTACDSLDEGHLDIAERMSNDDRDLIRIDVHLVSVAALVRGRYGLLGAGAASWRQDRLPVPCHTEQYVWILNFVSSIGVWRVEWDLDMAQEVRDWLHLVRKEDREAAIQIAQAITMLMQKGPGLGRPLVDTVRGSTLKNLKAFDLGPRVGARSGSCLSSTLVESSSCWPVATRPGDGKAGMGRTSD